MLKHRIRLTNHSPSVSLPHLQNSHQSYKSHSVIAAPTAITQAPSNSAKCKSTSNSSLWPFSSVYVTPPLPSLPPSSLSSKPHPYSYHSSPAQHWLLTGLQFSSVRKASLFSSGRHSRASKYNHWVMGMNLPEQAWKVREKVIPCALVSNNSVLSTSTRAIYCKCYAHSTWPHYYGSKELTI